MIPHAERWPWSPLGCVPQLPARGLLPGASAGSGLVFDDRGEHQLKGVPGSWRLYAVEH